MKGPLPAFFPSMGLRTSAGAAVAAVSITAVLAGPSLGAAEDGRPAPPLPTDASRWVGEPVSWESLRGRVTLVFVWTFG